jgi:hypothetical protein
LHREIQWNRNEQRPLVLIALVAISPILAGQYADAKKGKAATGSSQSDAGYRAGIAAAAKDVEKFNAHQIDGVDGKNPTTPCKQTSVHGYCDGYNKGYGDKAVDELD